MSGPSPGQGTHGYYQDPAAFYDQQQGQYDAQTQHNMNTVFEEDEPASSPELGRGDQQWSQDQYGYQHHALEQYQAQETGDYGYSQQHHDGGGYDYQEQSSQPQSQDQWDPPYYPGYLYDAATNSYISDPNWQPTPDDDHSASAGEQQYEGQSQDYDQQYSSYEQSQSNVVESQQYGNDGAAEVNQQDSEFESEDPYADDPYQLPDDQADPYSQYQNPQASSAAPPAQDPYSSQLAPSTVHSQGHDGDYNQPPTDHQDNAGDSYGSYDPYEGAGQTHDGTYSQGTNTEAEQYAVDSNPYGPEDADGAQEDPFAMSDQQQYDPFSNGGDAHGDQPDPYSQDAESYAQQAPDAYDAPSRTNMEHSDFYTPHQEAAYSAQAPPPATRQGGNGYGQERQGSSRDRSESHASTAPPGHQSNGYSQARTPAKAPSSNLRQAAASPPPPQHSSSQSGYAPSPQQQQYSSFASVYDAAAQTGATEPPHDPYAPVPKQSRERAYSGASNLSNRSRPSPAQAQAQVQSQQNGPGGRQAPFDPYSRPPAALSSSQGPPPSLPPLSPNMQERVAAAAPPPPATQAVSPPSASTARTSTFSPPPRSSSAQSNAGSTSAGRSLPPPRQQGAAQQQTAGAAFDIPPPRSAAPPNRQTRNAQPPRQTASQGSSAPVAAALSPAAQSVEAPRSRSPSVGPTRSHESQQSTSSSTSNSSGYLPPPPGSSSNFRAPPSSQKKPSPFGGVMQPPARRAPHQRGASAFGSDSPYGALPTGPLTSAYEPSGAGVNQIKEEAEEEENFEEDPPRAETQSVEQPQEEFVPSWMQATTPVPSQRGPYNPSAAPAPNVNKRDGRIPQGYPSAPPAGSVDSLADSLGQVSLEGREDRRQGPPPSSRPLQPAQRPQGPQQPRQPQQLQQPQQPPASRVHPSPQQSRPPQAGAAVPPPRNTIPPPSRLDPPPQNATSAPPPSRNPAVGGRPPAGNAPPRQSAPSRPPQQLSQTQPSARQQPPRPPVVPQLHFEPPSGEREYRPSGPTRPPPPAGQGSRSSTPVPMMVVEETAEEEEQYAKEESYDRRRDEDGYEGRQRDSGEGYEVDDGPSYGESSHTATGANTPSTTYGGDWQADGYDYVSGSHSQQSQEPQKPYDPYAPQPGQSFPHDPYEPQQSYADDQQEEDSVTPSVPQQATFDSPAGPPSPRKHLQQRQQPAQGRPASREPIRNSATNYSQYPQTSQSSQNNESYGAYSNQQHQQAYDPYGSGRQEPSAQASYGNSGSSEVADLQLDRRTAPLVSFGFGGRMLLVFPDGGSKFSSSSNYDPSNPYSATMPETQTSTPSTVHIRKLADILPPPTDAPFPGPIFLDGGKANSGKKRKDAIAWLGKRITELEDEVHHAQSRALDQERSLEERERETRLLLVKLVKVFVENDGKLVGTPDVDEAVRAILAPGSADSHDPTSLPTADQLASAASQGSNVGDASPFVTYGVSGTNLDEMTSLLLRGERREAVRYALDHRMWAHAFIIASCVDTDCWKDVTVEFLRSELTPSSNNAGEQGVQGREALRVAYSMFAGLGSESIEQFLPPRSLGAQNQAQLLPAAPIGSSQQNRVETQSRLPEATLASWRDTVAMIVANRTAGDSATLTALGDALASNGWIQASHVCYLLSPQTSLLGGFGSPTSRISLVGSAPSRSTGLDLESIKLTELVEFGCSLAPTVKGQESFAGFPHLQAFRLVHASVLAESGNIPQALKYTEAVVNTLKLATRPSPFYHPRLVAQVKLLGERLGAAPGQKETSSWIARKVPRPTVNSLWSTFEGGFNKFVSGEGEATPEQLAAKAEVAKVANGQPVGPFSHFSAIAPGSNSGTLSRAQSSTDLGGGNLHLANQPPPRPLSAAAPVPPALTSPQSNKPVHSPGPPPVKRAPFKTHHARSSSLGAFAGYDFNPTAPPPWQSYTPPAPRNKTGGDDDNAAAESPSTGTSERPKPQFAAVEDRFAEDDSGFISPMAQYTPSVSPTPGANRAAPTQNLSHRRMTTAEELADLGIGNSKSKKPAFDTLDEELEAEEGGAPPPAKSEAATNGSEPAAATSKSDDKPTIKPSKSWLGGWFKREASPAAQQVGPGPVKANLGEQKTFYYDEKLKRWVNNSGKGGDETPPAIVPPPRASTASPSRAMRGSPRFGSPAPPVPPMPPQRSQTAGPPPLSRSATSSDLRSQTQGGGGGDFRPPSRPGSAADGPQGSRGPGGTRRNKPKYVVVPP